MICLERLGPQHASGILAGQDAELADEIAGERWSRASLDAFLARAARWRADGPIQEFAATWEREADAAGGTTGDGDTADRGAGILLGGGGLNLLDPGLQRGEAALTYWILAAHRGRGHGRELVAALVARAREDARISRLVLRIAPTNDASHALARSIGARATHETERHPADAARRVERWILELRER
ncbi:GNAT family N-acetyltransferase [Brachybacterium vulturis]|uniref:GNAT family N-acetyltransferase n=1 Tax=Brachybacterium vulturis TaxID=2017484 RepID=UPI0037350958